MEVDYVFQDLADVPAGFSVPPERRKPWGTAHAAWLCRDVVKGAFGIINADDYYGRESYELLARFLKGVNISENTFALMGFKLRNTLSEYGTVARGICEVGKEGYLKSVVERLKIEKAGNAARFMEDDGTTWTPLTAEEAVSMNMWGFTPGIFKQLDDGLHTFFKARGQELKSEYLLPTAVNEMVKVGTAKVRVLNTPSSWFGITYKEDKAGVEEKLRKLVSAGVYPSDAKF